MPILSQGQTDIGMKRKTNQDSIALDHGNKFFIVADGMGGHNGGDIASRLTVKNMPELLKNNLDKEPKELLKLCVNETNKIIYTKAQEDESLKGMGTTVVAKLFKGPNLYVANVGDSRCYLFNNQKLFQVSKDHSFVQEKLNHAIYTRAEARFDKQKNVITRTVGFEPNVEVDVFTYKICKNDIFLICSDGLHGKVSDSDITFIVNKYLADPATATSEDIQETVKVLIDQANANGGQDNISVIISIAR